MLSWFWGNILGQETLNYHDPYMQYIIWYCIKYSVLYDTTSWVHYSLTWLKVYFIDISSGLSVSLGAQMVVIMVV